jgi:hypothetical protein
MPNLLINQTTHKLRLRVSSALRAPASGYQTLGIDNRLPGPTSRRAEYLPHLQPFNQFCGFAPTENCQSSDIMRITLTV